MYKMKEKALIELPPTPSTIRRHLLRSHNFVHLANLLDSCDKILEPANDGEIIKCWLLQEFCHCTIRPHYKVLLLRRDVPRIVDVRGHSKSAQSTATV